jgi:hypothetical protein
MQAMSRASTANAGLSEFKQGDKYYFRKTAQQDQDVYQA